MTDNRNMILAIALSALVLLGWGFITRYFLPTPPQVVATAPATNAPAATAPAPAGPAANLPGAGTVPGAVPGAAAPAALRDRAAVLASTPRVRIDSPRLAGSLNLTGARIDDLVLKSHRQSLAKASPPIRLFTPQGTADAYFGQFGWAGPGAPPADARWTASAAVLTPAAPVTLRWASPTGAVFEILLAIDDGYMFTARQTVRNPGAVPLAVRPWGLVSKLGEGNENAEINVHVGPVAVVERRLNDTDLEYGKLRDDGPKRFDTVGGWYGITGKFWLAALVPDQQTRVEARFSHNPGDVFQADYLQAPLAVPATGAATTTTRLYAGAMEVAMLDRYEAQYGIPLFDKAISWGWFYFIAKPIFYLLHWLFVLTGNFGVAIIGLTLIVRAVLFPIANKQYASMAKLRVVAPKMKELQDRFKDDKPKLQQEMMELYKKEKVNPLAGCLPILLQIPIFYALYKTLLVSIEMRHQPFVAWIRDLSAPDPLTPVNLFGLLPFQPPAIIALGVLPILLGITMWLQQKLSPPPPDPIQKQVFAILPWVFMFIMAPFAAGLQLYWTINNIVSIGQQWLMLKKYPAPATPAPAPK